MATAGQFQFGHWTFQQGGTSDGGLYVSYNDFGGTHSNTTYAQGVATPVPEPETWALMIAGVVLLSMRKLAIARWK